MYVRTRKLAVGSLVRLTPMHTPLVRRECESYFNLIEIELQTHLIMEVRASLARVSL
jgi:hypothetical protein